MKKWYAVHAKPRQDARAEENLRNQGFEVFRPLARLRRRVRNGMVEAVESLFPRYLFVQLDVDRDHWGVIRSTKGVAGFVQFTNAPTPVGEQVVSGIRAMMSGADWIDLSSSNLADGTPVRVTEGPFAGYEGQFFSREGEDRVIVLLTVMQRAQRVVLPEHHIEAA
ncbi:MAG: transcription/translation regulatory transformer protein RfaH [Pseudomonadales bacterium]|nr:transcription/translation regulatory transformer protein RfaH [Pseudomonadales bacterium]